MTSCRRDIVTSDTSGLYDYPFNFPMKVQGDSFPFLLPVMIQTCTNNSTSLVDNKGHYLITQHKFTYLLQKDAVFFLITGPTLTNN